MTADETCGSCGHSLARDVHDPRDGCLHGWEWDDNGIFTKEGCHCELTKAGQLR